MRSARIPPRSHDDVIARYGNWYHGADDLFAHCLILRSAQCAVLFQGLNVVTLHHHLARPGDHERLLDMLSEPIPDDWPAATYEGFNFITDAESPAASEIAVFGVKPTDPLPPGQYYAAPTDSDVAALVKQIAQID